MDTWTGQWGSSTGWSSRFPLWDGPATLVLAFGGDGLGGAPEPIHELAAAYPRSVVMGCSSSGEILGDTLAEGSLTVAVIRFCTTRLVLATTRVMDRADSRAAGRRLATELLDREPALAGVFVLSDGLVVNGSELTLGLTEGNQGQTCITGGLAGDGDRFEDTWVLEEGTPRPGVVAAVGLAGPDVRIGHGSYGGWSILGPERRVSRSEGNVLYELDDQPALDLYRLYLGDRASGLPATALLFPLAVRLPGANERHLVRTVLGIDDATRSMTFAGDIPQGSLAQLMRANVDKIVDGAYLAAANAQPIADSAVLAIAISCVGRRLLLGQRTEDELEAMKSGLPAGSTVVGFYAYGEISPVAPGTCDLLNQTMTITTIQEPAPTRP